MTPNIWSNGEAISLEGVPLLKLAKAGCGVTLVMPFAAKNGGTFTAHYRFREKRGPYRWMYEFSHAEEIMPPTPPQIQGFSNDARLPMWHAADEAEQRKREWTECRRDLP
jgi:hypothetical protein